MSFLLDTCTVSYFLKENTQVLNHISNVKPRDLNISVITFFEIEYGFKLNKTKNLDELIKRWVEFSKLIKIINFDNKIALTTANIRIYLREKEIMIGAYDILIGATAVTHKMVCVTSNTSEFARIKNLEISDWTK